MIGVQFAAFETFRLHMRARHERAPRRLTVCPVLQSPPSLAFLLKAQFRLSIDTGGTTLARKLDKYGETACGGGH